MAHILRLISNAFTTINLNSGDNSLIDYVPVKSNEPQVTENVIVSISGSAVTDISDTINDIEDAFRRADRRFDRSFGDRVYVEFQPDGYESVYRSELVRPAVDLSSGRVNYTPRVLGDRWTAKNIEVQIEWTRKNYWEASSESELSLSNGGGSGTGGQAIYNIHGAAALSDTSISFADTNDRISDSNNGLGVFVAGDIISVRGSTSNDGVYSVESVAGDGSTLDINEDVLADEAAGDSVSIYDVQNYVHIDSANISGSLHTPARIEVTNSDAGDSLETAWMSLNNLSSPTAFPHLLEIGDSDTGSDSSDANMANGIKRSYSIGTSEAKVTGWTLNSEQLTSADGNYFKVFTRFAAITNATDVKWRLKLLYSSSVIWEGEQVQFDDTYALISRLIRAIDTVQLPPYIPENSAPAAIDIELWGESTTGGSVSVAIDCLVLMPLDGYRRMRSIDGIAQNSILIDDGITETYYQEVSSKQVGDIAIAGQQVMLDPTKDNRIYFLLHSVTANTADYDRDASVSMHYRPRRVTL